MNRHKKVCADFVITMGVEAKNHFVRNFSKQGFLDSTLNPWAKRKSKKQTGRGILIKTGDLRRSIQVIKKNRFGVTVGSDLPYAKIHNEGGVIKKKQRHSTLNFRIKRDGTSRFAKANKANFQQDVAIGAHSVKMPKRQFMGNSVVLKNKLSNILKKEINKAFKK